MDSNHKGSIIGSLGVFFVLSKAFEEPIRLSLIWVTSWSDLTDIFATSNIDLHYDDVIMTMLASQITSLTVVYSIVYSGVNQRKHQSSASLAFVREIHRGPMNFPHKWPVTRKMFPFDDVIMVCKYSSQNIFNANKAIHIKTISLVNMATCTQGMQRIWWPVASTTIATGSYQTIASSLG